MNIEREAAVTIMNRVRDLASNKAAVIFIKSSCCMCHSIKQLFYELGVSLAVHELDIDAYGREMARALRGMGCNPSVLAMFFGGKFVGSVKDIISLHVDGSLKQLQNLLSTQLDNSTKFQQCMSSTQKPEVGNLGSS
ncbi:glutaredoxin-C11-like [Prosopis cineraria]|uniref:glutaredoxin-C11-like n=1 Tax=Prosopis cineraria TaxID=364024 RepID=UPI00240FEB3E|nr:glutaredoxin-C11-like [Prosopis cineraria]